MLNQKRGICPSYILTHNLAAEILPELDLQQIFERDLELLLVSIFYSLATTYRRSLLLSTVMYKTAEARAVRTLIFHVGHEYSILTSRTINFHQKG